jgi:hypothetical protein
LFNKDCDNGHWLKLSTLTVTVVHCFGLLYDDNIDWVILNPTYSLYQLVGKVVFCSQTENFPWDRTMIGNNTW